MTGKMTIEIGLTRGEVVAELVKSGRTEDEANALIDQAVARLPRRGCGRDVRPDHVLTNRAAGRREHPAAKVINPGAGNMTITEITAPALDLRAMTDDELLDLYRSDGTAAAMALAEVKRRDQADRRERAERQLQDEWYNAMHAQRMQAEAYCQGWLLSKEARRLNAIAEESGKVAVSEWQLWTGPAWLVKKYASEELLAYLRRPPAPHARRVQAAAARSRADPA